MDNANTTTSEIWKPVVGWEEYYEVSSLGRVRRRETSRIRKTHLGGYGRYHVDLWKQNQNTNYSVHRLVAEAFLGPLPKGYHTNHIDGNAHNNALANLEYVTPKQNSEHASRLGLIAHGERHCRAHLNNEQVIEIRRLHAQGASMQNLARQFNTGARNIHSVVTHRTWRHISP